MAKENEVMIGGLPKSRWVEAFAAAVKIAIDKDYFSDILFYGLYEDKLFPEEIQEDHVEALNHAIDFVYDNSEILWKNVEEAFEEVFGIKYNH